VRLELTSGIANLQFRFLLVAVILTMLVSAQPAALAGKAPTPLAGNEFEGRWVLTITIPESADSRNSRTFTVTVDASPRGDSLHGRLTVTDGAGRTVGGAWRQVGKRVSIVYELPCPGDGPCASLIMLGKIKGENTRLKKGAVIVMWDSPNDRNFALYDTSNGSVTGERLQ
jgi:hypothetical protein